MTDQSPVRIAVLGGDSTGKTSFISRLTVNMVHEAHYPTRNQNNWLFDYIPHSKLSKTLLDSQNHERLLMRTPNSQTIEPIFKSPQLSPYVLLSPLTFQSFINDFNNVKNQNKSKSSNNSRTIDIVEQDTKYYKYITEKKSILDKNASGNNNNGPSINNKDINAKYFSTVKNKYKYTKRNLNNIERVKEVEASVKIPGNYVPPDYTPILIDIIDTPGFKPEMVVPFLEVSLFRNLGKNILHGLADEPRRAVSTTSLLVASGAAELNGKIDGYIFTYSAVPELSHNIEPPTYMNNSTNCKDAQVKNSYSDSQNKNKNNSDEYDKYQSWSTFTRKTDGGFSLLDVIRSSMLDAWAEFRTYQRGWEKGKEQDVYSLGYSLKNMWKTEKERTEKLQQLREFKTELPSIEIEPSSPDAPPPVIIVCTHLNDQLASPVLIEWGRTLATKWKCGFVAVDTMDDCNVDVALSMLIRDIVEKDRLINNNVQHKEHDSGTTLMSFLSR
ncbi:hypothetical protein TPHA_0A03430 [Tetrapisispora phaffii CBS 4417]|uniref:Uncharacterized protein n=1 Tax=Tetrapisispora phaffii (strain ATCC 24235 / CBS 4417 / NBRC 1672 / NRRL Y-8282 / UCD 70-5) TaxID=1071381 RepID=G8BNE2_TETPH|nr:hypothetical protein TPHA_0A03430 [Tetrapisispora phaffii CBS 4417]CCE61420.1 hypothetical protein TPHA_0A03430 [Tetrapisispora phaffii CBS 4417]